MRHWLAGSHFLRVRQQAMASARFAILTYAEGRGYVKVLEEERPGLDGPPYDIDPLLKHHTREAYMVSGFHQLHCLVSLPVDRRFLYLSGPLDKQVDPCCRARSWPHTPVFVKAKTKRRRATISRTVLITCARASSALATPHSKATTRWNTRASTYPGALRIDVWTGQRSAIGLMIGRSGRFRLSLTSFSLIKTLF